MDDKKKLTDDSDSPLPTWGNDCPKSGNAILYRTRKSPVFRCQEETEDNLDGMRTP